MATVTFNALFPSGFPVAVLFGGDRLPSHVTEHTAAVRQPIGGIQDQPEPPNRLTFVEHWAKEKDLILDFLFSFVYGGALAVSLWWVWATLGHPFHPAWIAAPFAMLLATDWMEHLMQLAQLYHYGSSNGGRVLCLWMKASYFATIIKLWLTFGLYASLTGLVVKLIVTHSHRRHLMDAAH